jgi:hypothetical protein
MNASWDKTVDGDSLALWNYQETGTLFVLAIFTPLLVGKLSNPAGDNIWITGTLCVRK